MTAAAIPAGRGLDAPDDCRRCAPAQGADRAPDPQGAAVVPTTFHEQLAAAGRARHAPPAPAVADTPGAAPCAGGEGMTAPSRSQEFPGAFAYEHTDIPAGLTIREWRQPRHRCRRLRALWRRSR
jgi:hypothetical protein